MIERIKAMLAMAGVRSPGIEPRIPGGKAPEITGLDVMGALAPVPRLGGYVCIAKYARDPYAKQIAAKLLTHYILLKGEDKRIEQQEAEGMAEFILDIEVELFDRCPACQGRKLYLFRGIPQTCKKCGGTGKIEFSEHKMAKYCGIDRDTWRNRKYTELFKAAHARLHELESAALYIAESRLRDDERVA